MNQKGQRGEGPHFNVGDEVAYAMGKGMRYGSVVRVIGPDKSAIEIEFEDGGREVHKTRDRALSLLRRATGVSERDEELGDRKKVRDFDVDVVRRADQRRRW